METFNVGDRVWLQSGGYGGLNYHFLREEGFYDEPGEVIEIQDAHLGRYARYMVKSSVTGRVVKVYLGEMQPVSKSTGT